MTAAPPLQRRLRPSATDAAFRALIAEAGQDVRALVSALVSGDLTPAEWSDQMLETLAHAHAEAGYRGRLRAGDLAPYDRDDLRFGQLVAQEQMAWLWKFQRDLEGGRYGTGEPDAAAIQRRAAMYVTRLYGTANEAWGLTVNEPLWWRLGDSEESCRSCPRLAEGSPYAPGALRVWPKSGATECNINCKCRVTTADGRECFGP